MRGVVDIERRRRGFTLLEVVLVIAVGLGLILGSISLHGMATDGHAVRMKAQELRMVIDDIEARVPGRKEAGNLEIGAYDPVSDSWTGAFAGRSNLPPSFFRDLTFFPSQDGTGYVIQVDGMPPRICYKLAKVDFGRPTYTTHPLYCESELRFRITRHGTPE